MGSDRGLASTFGRPPNLARQLHVPLDPRTGLLLQYYCTTTVLQYCYCTILLLPYYYCTTTVLLLYYYMYYYCTVLHTTAPYQASDVVDCGGECRLDAKAFKIKGFQVWQLSWSDRGSSLNSSKYT